MIRFFFFDESVTAHFKSDKGVKVEKEGMPPIQADWLPDGYYAKEWVEMYKNQNIIDSFEVMVVRIGEFAFVGLPGEIFCEFGLDIKKRSPCKNAIDMGLTNYDKNYFPRKVSFTFFIRIIIALTTCQQY